MKKIGIITFHNSYNCGSMLETYAIQQILSKLGYKNEIIDYSSVGQRELYQVWFKNSSIKNIIKNIIICPFYKKIKNNNSSYEKFKNKNFKMSKTITNKKDLKNLDYVAVIAGSDQIWNITIDDYDDAYFLDWVNNSSKIAYAPSFGSKNILKYSSDIPKYIELLNDFDYLSIRENNGKVWLKQLINKEVEVLIDPTLLLTKEDYDNIKNNEKINYKYIFFYSPGFDDKICSYVKKIADKYKLKVITWSSKSYYVKIVKRYGFVLPDYESPDMYLNLIANAEMIITTSYHGTIFSTIYKKKYITVKNGEMYGDDDRVITLLQQLGMLERLIEPEFDEEFDYLGQVDYSKYDEKIESLKEKAISYLNSCLENKNEARK